MLDPMRNDGVPIVRVFKSKRIKRTHMPHACRTCGGDIPVGGPAVKVILMTSDDQAPGTYYEHSDTKVCLQVIENP